MYFLSALATAILLLAALAFSMVVVTRQQNVRIIETFGKFSSVRSPGLSFMLPWPIQTASHNFSTQVMEIAEDVGVKSRDNAFVTVPIRVQFRVDEANAKDAYYRLANPVQQIRSYVVNQVRSTASSKSFDELFQSRNAFEADVESTLKARMSEFGFVIENVLVDDPQPSDELRTAFDRVIASERLKEAAENEGEAAKILTVKRAQAEKIGMELRGEALANFRKTITTGNGEAIQMFIRGTGLTAQEGLAFILAVNEMDAVTNAAQAGGQLVFIAGSAARSGADPVLAALLKQEGSAHATGDKQTRTPWSVSSPPVSTWAETAPEAI